jgi:hypothetical protein
MKLRFLKKKKTNKQHFDSIYYLSVRINSKISWDKNKTFGGTILPLLLVSIGI